MNRLSALFALALAACSSSPPATADVPSRPAGIELLDKLVGLWSGPVTDTRLGDFPLTNMDFRAASDSVLFARVDLDEENSLRFAFEVELHDGASVLVFRNGGLFQGMARDTRTALIESDGSHYRFCAIEGGCAYVDADFRFASETSFELTVMVRGALHEHWSATRVETRTLPAGFPVHTDLSAAADFPPMPGVQVEVSWASAVASETDVWIVLSTSSCVPTGDCQFSRWIRGRAMPGATSVTIMLDQVHAGPYHLLAVLDANNNLIAIRLPDHGDLVSLPSPSITIAPEGVTEIQATANFALP